MIAAEQALHPGLIKHGGHELGRDVPLQKAIAVLGKRRVIPHCIVNAYADKPAEQEVELQPLHQLPLRPDRVERLQQHRPQKLLRRDRWSTHAGIERRELARERRQRLVHNAADDPQRMVLANPRFQIDVAEQRPRPFVPAPHQCASAKRMAKESQSSSAGQ
jgi:hypothetical protein